MADAEASWSSAPPGVKNLDASALPPEDCCKDPSDITELQDKEVVLLDGVESEELVEMEVQNSKLSYKEPMGMQAEFDTSASPILSLEESDLEPPEAVELLMCVEEPEVEEVMDDVPLTTLTPATPLSESPAFISAPEMIFEALHYLPCPQELLLSSRIAPEPAESNMSSKLEVTDEPNAPPVSSDSPIEGAQLKAQPQMAAPACRSFELPVLLTGGVALVAVVVVMTYVSTRK
ncbi:hypothetical protein NFI96_004564 [Prochilodus magdalenae]|nr:hypothetical protein NFI96_004564 [Prochilodus magdalenae]